MSDPTSQRRFDRIDVTIRTIYHDEIDADESDSLMSNLSQGGCFIRTTRPLASGSPIRFRFKLPDTETVIEAAGVVRWAQDSGAEEERGMGVQFQEIRQGDLLSLKQYIAQKLESSLLW